jgi:hypothetical protein
MNQSNIYELPSVEMLKARWEEIQNKVEKAARTCSRNLEEIKVIAVSKTHSDELILRAIKAGITTFGENYVQELKDKFEQINQISEKKPEWHFIGHLQTNKVKYIAPFISTIHSVDSAHLAEEISRQAFKNERTIDILLQVNTSGEESKFGCEPNEILNLTESVLKIPNLNVCGLMTIGSFSENDALVRFEFRLLRSLQIELIKHFGEEHFKHLSMGMTSDFEKAIEEGATMIRIGTAIFGERHYS